MRTLLIITLFMCISCATHFGVKSKNQFIEQQFDHFQKKNSCGEIRASRLKVLSIHFDLPENLADGGALEFIVTELLSQNRKRVTYEAGVFSYYNLFGKSVHKELNPPYCIGGQCRFEIYVFTNDWTVLRDVIDLRLSIRGKNLEKVIKFDAVKNSFEDSTAPDFPAFDVSYLEDRKEGYLKLPAKSFAFLRSQGAREVEVVLQWKTGSADKYHESSHMIDLQADFIIVKQTLPGIKYFAGMIMYKNDKNAFESKVEVKNDFDPFYECHEK